MLNFNVHFLFHCYYFPTKILECFQGTYFLLSVIQKEIVKHAQRYQLMFILLLRVQGRRHHSKVIIAVYDS